MDNRSNEEIIDDMIKSSGKVDDCIRHVSLNADEPSIKSFIPIKHTGSNVVIVKEKKDVIVKKQENNPIINPVVVRKTENIKDNNRISNNIRNIKGFNCSVSAGLGPQYVFSSHFLIPDRYGKARGIVEYMTSSRVRVSNIVSPIFVGSLLLNYINVNNIFSFIFNIGFSNTKLKVGSVSEISLRRLIDDLRTRGMELVEDKKYKECVSKVKLSIGADFLYRYIFGNGFSLGFFLGYVQKRIARIDPLMKESNNYYLNSGLGKAFWAKGFCLGISSGYKISAKNEMLLNLRYEHVSKKQKFIAFDMSSTKRDSYNFLTIMLMVKHNI